MRKVRGSGEMKRNGEEMTRRREYKRKGEKGN